MHTKMTVTLCILSHIFFTEPIHSMEKIPDIVPSKLIQCRSLMRTFISRAFIRDKLAQCQASLYSTVTLVKNGAEKSSKLASSLYTSSQEYCKSVMQTLVASSYLHNKLDQSKAFIHSTIELAKSSAEKPYILASTLYKKTHEFCRQYPQQTKFLAGSLTGLSVIYLLARSAIIHGIIKMTKQKIAFKLLHAGYISTLDWALAHGADINQTFKYGKTALHIAADEGDAERVRQLIAHNANFKIFDELIPFQYPIHYAARNGHIAVIEQLVNAGDDINMALWAAAESGQLETVKWTIQHGADLMKQAQGGCTALAIAQRNKHEKIEKYLLSLRPAPQNTTNIDDDSCIHFTQILYDAITQQNIDRARLAIKSYASLVHADENQSPLRLTIAPSEEPTPTPLDKIAQDLVEAGAPLRIGDAHGNTPLHSAASIGNTRLAKLFLRYGADTSSLNKQYYTALDIALEYRNLDMQSLLATHMTKDAVQVSYERFARLHSAAE